MRGPFILTVNLTDVGQVDLDYGVEGQNINRGVRLFSAGWSVVLWDDEIRACIKTIGPSPMLVFTLGQLVKQKLSQVQN